MVFHLCLKDFGGLKARKHLKTNENHSFFSKSLFFFSAAEKKNPGVLENDGFPLFLKGFWWFEGPKTFKHLWKTIIFKIIGCFFFFFLLGTFSPGSRSSQLDSEVWKTTMTAQHSATQHNTAQHSTAQPSTGTPQHTTATPQPHHSTPQHCKQGKPKGRRWWGA